jgi:hypothetical protein
MPIAIRLRNIGALCENITTHNARDAAPSLKVCSYFASRRRMIFRNNVRLRDSVLRNDVHHQVPVTQLPSLRRKRFSLCSAGTDLQSRCWGSGWG